MTLCIASEAGSRFKRIRREKRKYDLPTRPFSQEFIWPAKISCETGAVKDRREKKTSTAEFLYTAMMGAADEVYELSWLINYSLE